MSDIAKTVIARAVPGRRELHFSTLDGLAIEARALVENPNTKMLGNWPLERILAHLTVAIAGSMDGNLPKAPLIARLIGPFLKKRFLKNPMKPGFNLPRNAEEEFYPDRGTAQAVLIELEKAILRTKTTPMIIAHPVLGKMTHEDWTQLHLRHAELHLSFAVPGS